MTLYVFNPEHDYALANDDEHFVAPSSAVRFARDCALFPAFYAYSPTLPAFHSENQTYTIETPTSPVLVFQPYQSDMFCVDATTGIAVNSFESVTEVAPWGWDKLIIRQLLEAGLPSHLLPGPEKADTIRKLANRQIASQALHYMHQHNPNHHKWPQPAQALHTLEDIRHFIDSAPAVLLKSPYSGNGRGHLYACGRLTPTLQRQCLGVLRKQKMLLGEYMYKVIQDFAIEFHCHNGQAHFCGYSLFQTKHYGYLHNILMSDEEILHHLSQWVDLAELEEAKLLLLHFIEEVIAPCYDGYLGVDMFVYEQESYRLHPAVEINLRMTMGMAAHRIHQQYVHPAAHATLKIIYKPTPKELTCYAREMKKLKPLTCDNGKWIDGHILLTPVNDNTQYAIEIDVHLNQKFGY